MRNFILSCGFLLTALTCHAQYQLDTITYAGNSNIFNDIVFLGDGFQENEMQMFVDFVKSQSNQFFDKVPWKNYKAMFNIFYVKTPSNVSGAGMTPSEPIDNIFGTCFGTSGVDRMPWPTKWAKVYEVLNSTKPDYDMVVIVVNSQKYGGGGSSKFICYSLNDNSIETLRHESGHALGNLADEYWYRGRESANMTTEINPVKWERWIGVDGVGVYPYDDAPADQSPTWYRPHQNCLMRYLYREYCPVCREALIERIHINSKSIKDFTPQNGDEINIRDNDVTFALNLLKPEPNTLRVEWQMDGIDLARDIDQLTLKAGTIGKGQHALSVTVEDTTSMVRVPDHTSLHASTVTWTINVEVSTGIHTVSASEHDFTVGPLPFTSEVTFASKNPMKGAIRMQLWDAEGRCAATTSINGSDRCSLSTTSLPKGIYVLRVYVDDQLIYNKKVTKG